MQEDSFDAVQKRIADFDLAEVHPAEDWQGFFDDGIKLLEHPESEIKQYAIERMQKGLWSEKSQRYREPGFIPAPAEQRLVPILDSIARQAERDHQLLLFTRWSSLTDEQSEVFASWLKEAEDKAVFAPDTCVIASIHTKLFNSDDWLDAQSFLSKYFDDKNDLLRAAAAAAFGEMYADGADNMPALDALMEQVKAAEIARPGFAGPFIGELLMDVSDGGEIEGSGVKLTDWLLEIIAKRQSDEPVVPFYNGIDFHAHEVLSGNPDAVRKLIDYGAEHVALMTATEINQPITGMDEHLKLLANSSDPLVARIAAWHLAYNYRYLHPEGLRHGYVSCDEREDVDIFLVFAPEEYQDSPFAATIYPKDEYLTDAIAWKWVDKLIPPEVRPPMSDNQWPYQSPNIDAEYAMYVYGAFIVNLYGYTANKKWDRVWVKFPLGPDEW